MQGWLRRCADAVGGALFGCLFLVFLVQITARFVFDRPLPWTDELAVILYIWVILWASAFMVKPREHVVFDLVYNHVGPGVRRVMRFVGSAMLAVLAAMAVPGSWDYIKFMNREGTPVLGLSFMWVFLPFLAMLLAVVVRYGGQAWRALRNAGEES